MQCVVSNQEKTVPTDGALLPQFSLKVLLVPSVSQFAVFHKGFQVGLQDESPSFNLIFNFQFFNGNLVHLGEKLSQLIVFCLGTILILRNHIFRIFGPPSPPT